MSHCHDSPAPPQECQLLFEWALKIKILKIAINVCDYLSGIHEIQEKCLV